jgi:hypothetical protein
VFGWNFNCDTSKKKSRRNRTPRRVRQTSIRFEAIRNPHVSAVRWKKLSCAIRVQVHSVMSIYIHICIYILSRLILTVAIASFKLLNL